MVRLFGGRDLSVTHDTAAGTLTILGQSLTLSSIPSALQAEWQTAISGASSTFTTVGRPAFGGGNIESALSDILSNQATWRSAVTAALAGYVQEQTSGGSRPRCGYLESIAEQNSNRVTSRGAVLGQHRRG